MKEETKRLLTACFLTLFIVIFIFAQRGLLKETNIVKWDFTLRSLFNNKATIFLLKNRIDIILVVLMIILISVIFTTSEFKPNKLQPRVQNTVVIEGLTSLNDSEKSEMVKAVVDELIARYKCGENCQWSTKSNKPSEYPDTNKDKLTEEWNLKKNNTDDYDKYLGYDGYMEVENKILAKFKDELDKISFTDNIVASNTDLENIKATLLAVGDTEIKRVDKYREEQKQQRDAGIMIPNICDDELQKLRPIYQDEIDIGMGSYNENMGELRQQINDKNITLTEQEIRNKISGLKTNNIQLQQDISHYIARRKGNCEMDKNNNGAIMDSESTAIFSGSVQGFTNMFSKNTFKEALQTLKQDLKLLENMDNQYNKTNSDIETDLIKNEYRTGAYALGIVIVGGLIVSRFQNK